MLIKICGVKDPEIASFSVQQGAQLIGMILTPDLRRSVTLTQAQKISEATRKAGAVPVAVFVSPTAEQVESHCEQLGIDLVQVYHFSKPLPEHLKRIYINQPEVLLRPDSDLLLMESARPGSGEMIEESNFMIPKSYPWLIAGGLNPENVKQMIQRYRPQGVDVSSGVEKEGVKSRELILQFIQQVRSSE